MSPWFTLLVNTYPIFETLFTIWRRKVRQGKNPCPLDGAHFYSLIYRRLTRWAEVHETKDTAYYAKNTKTSPYLWLLSSLAVLSNTDIQYNMSFAMLCIVFCASYVWTYNAVVKFKTPGTFNLLKQSAKLKLSAQLFKLRKLNL